jgi:acetoin utilization protein AcuB
MFQIISAQGVNNFLAPGEFRNRRRVQPVVGVDVVSNTTDLSPSQLHLSGGQARGKHEALTSRYQSAQTPAEPSEILFVREIMTKTVTSAPPTAGISEVAGLFSEHRYRHLPIVSTEGAIVGLLSDRDVLKYQAIRERRERDEALVSSIMVSEVLVATPDTLIRDVARTMFQERIGCLPIVDERNSLVGIVTRSDIMRALIAHGPMRLWA